MNKLFLSLSALLISASCLNATECYDSERCLPPTETDNHLFPKCKSFFGQVDFLYWTLKEGALDYAIDDFCCKKKSPFAGVLPYGEVKTSHFKFRPGVRVSVGYYNAPRLWEITGEYTYYKTHGSDCTTANANAECPLISTHPLIPTSLSKLNSASAENHFKYELGDFFVARVFDPNPHLRMRFLAGITGAYLDHHFQAAYQAEDSLVKDSMTIDYQDHWTYKAGGLRLGLTADWWWHWGLYMTGKATLAGYIGSYKNTFCEVTNNALVGGLNYKDTRFAEQIQLLVGPSWQHVGRCFHYSVMVGYEINGWFNLQESLRTAAVPFGVYKPVVWNTSALALHGLTVRLNAGF